MLTIVAATVPSTMNKPSVSAVSAHDSLKYRITITPPYSGGTGISIDSYELQVKTRTGTFSAPSDCFASSLKTNYYCNVALSTLTQAPFNLILSDQIEARVRAVNSIGSGNYSELSDSTTNLIVSLPGVPASAPYRDEPSCTKT